MLTDLELLRSRLADSIGGGRRMSGPWDVPGLMAERVDGIRQQFGGRMGDVFDRQVVARAVAEFRQTGKVALIHDLKYVCFGAGYFAADGYCLLADAPRLEHLLKRVATAPGRLNRMRIYRALLRSYWAFPLHGGSVPAEALNGWKRLRDWLRNRYDELALSRTRKPVWFSMLAPHLDLLSDMPCARFSPELLEGDATGLQRAIDTLQIPEEAWVKEEAVLAQLRAGAAEPDERFKAMLPRLMEIAAGKAGIAVTDMLARKCLAILLARWAGCLDYRPCPDLFLAALDRMGTPWANRPLWDDLILDANSGSCAETREMVGNWLKEELIENYFLSSSQPRGTAELWKTFSVFVDEMWVGLGDMRNGTDSLVQYARYCPIETRTGQSPALLMRIGAHFVVVRDTDRDGVMAAPWHGLAEKWRAHLRSGWEAGALDLGEMLAATPHSTCLAAGNTAQLEEQVRALLLNRNA
ncbi:MAG: EH signature domain-containing protein [Sterolibacterium sp.]